MNFLKIKGGIMEKYNRFYTLKEQLKTNPMTIGISTQMDMLIERYGEEYIAISENLLKIMEDLGYNIFEQAKHYMVDYIKGMMKFLQKGTYSNGTYDEIQQSVYDNEDKMINIYLPGLLLAHAVTILVYTKCHLFFNDFLPKIKKGAKGVDVGFGEGFYMLEILENIEDSICYGFDISNHSLKFAPKIFEKAGISKERYILNIGDIRSSLPIEDNSLDYAVIAEVVEHIDNPENALKELSRVLKKDGILFLSTVKDSNHMDHITNFPSSEYVENMIQNEGFEITAKSIQRNQDDFPESKDISVGLAYVCKKIK